MINRERRSRARRILRRLVTQAALLGGAVVVLGLNCSNNPEPPGNGPVMFRSPGSLQYRFAYRQFIGFAVPFSSGRGMLTSAWATAYSLYWNVREVAYRRSGGASEALDSVGPPCGIVLSPDTLEVGSPFSEIDTLESLTPVSQADSTFRMTAQGEALLDEQHLGTDWSGAPGVVMFPKMLIFNENLGYVIPVYAATPEILAASGYTGHGIIWAGYGPLASDTNPPLGNSSLTEFRRDFFLAHELMHLLTGTSHYPTSLGDWDRVLNPLTEIGASGQVWGGDSDRTVFNDVPFTSTKWATPIATDDYLPHSQCYSASRSQYVTSFYASGASVTLGVKR